jgi:hypothetical protein
MSLPTAKLSQLSLGKMPTTRAQSSQISQTGQDLAEDESSDSEAGASGGASEAETPEILYDKRELSQGASDRLEAAFDARFAVEYCGERTDSSGRGTYIVFHMAETLGHLVRIGASGGTYNNVECSNCNEPQPCRHVFWLLDQINRHTLTDTQKSGPVVLSKHGYPSELPGPFERIAEIGLEKLAERTKWEVRPAHYTEPSREAKAAEIREMMAALSPRIAEEYRPDIFNNLLVDQSFDGAIAQRDLAALVARLLMVDHDMFHHFRALVSPNHCATDFFIKMRDRVDAVFSRNAKYLGSGRPEDSNEICDIPWCARNLIDIVGAVRNKILKSTLGRPAKAEAAELLVYILGEVVDRNGDAYSGRIWDKTPQRRMPDKEKNLFHRLTVSPARSAEPPFIQYELNFLTDASQHLADRLEEIVEHMAQGGAPSGYAGKFRELISRMKRGDLPSGPKRSGPEMGGDPKRMK